MRLPIALFLVVSTLSCDAQSLEATNQGNAIQSAIDYFRQGDTPAAINVLTEAIKTDSLCPELYLFNAYVKLWDFYEFGDSAIDDIDRYLYLRTEPHLSFCKDGSDTFESIESEILNYVPPKEICGLALDVRAKNVVYGVNAYLKMGKEEPCEYWQLAVDNDFNRAEYLLRKYCR